jgi:hypothetical protein
VVLWSGVLWADCIRALRRAGYVCAAESPTVVMLVSGGRVVVLPRTPALDESVLRATLRTTGLSAEEFVALLRE